MKNFKKYLSGAIVFAMLFTSCSKDENHLDDTGNKTASISFATVLNDLTANKAALKQALSEMPECSEEAPSYVEVVLSGTADVGTMAVPLKINVNPNPGDYDGDGVAEYFTEESSELKLEPGNYSLEYFAVYDTNGILIWVAPIAGSPLANFVDNPLPIEISLGAGVKKYVDVDVICFDDRDVNEYGYLFFDIEATELFKFCFFANYCNENGRHFPAHYSVDIWIGTDNTGAILYSNEMNMVENEGEDPSAAPLCFALPKLSQFDDDEDYIYYEVTLEDWNEVYGDVSQTVIKGTLSINDVEANFVGEDQVDYEHLRFGCGDDDPEEPRDSDQDGIPDSEDNCPEIANPDQADADGDGIGDVCDECPNQAGPAENDGCPVDEEPDADEDGIPDSEDNCPEIANPDQADADGDGIGDACDECPNEPGLPENMGCPEDEPEVCVMENPDNGCVDAYLEGDSGWVKIEDPGEFPDPLRLMELGAEVSLGTVTITLNDGDPTFVMIGSEGAVDDYLIEVSQNSDGLESSCVVEEDIAPPSEDEPDALVVFPKEYSYPFYVKVAVNICSPN